MLTRYSLRERAAIGYSRRLMPLPLFGPLDVLVHAVRPFAIHGDMYYELQVTPVNDPGDASALRLANHLLSPPPRAGERLTLTFLMGQVTGARRPG